jgi:hypothetical protein
MKRRTLRSKNIVIVKIRCEAYEKVKVKILVVALKNDGYIRC